MLSSLRDELEEVFRDVFDDQGVTLRDEMTANDIERWDSMTHNNLIIAVERRFRVKFATAELSSLKGEDQNIGAFVGLITRKLDAGS